MKINKFHEETLWRSSRNSPLFVSDCKEIVGYLFVQLQNVLQNPIQISRRLVCTSEGFCIDFKGIITSPAFFDITDGDSLNMKFSGAENSLPTFGGTLGMQPINAEFGISVSANIYIFANNQRMVSDNKDFIYLEYIRGSGNVGEWISRGWSPDEYFGEYADIEENEFFRDDF